LIFQKTEKVQRVRMVGIVLQDLIVESFRFGQAAVLMEIQAAFKNLLRGGHFSGNPLLFSGGTSAG
jgi:hypothetical protein